MKAAIIDLRYRMKDVLRALDREMESLRGGRYRKAAEWVDRDFQTLPLTENIGHRAAVSIEEFSLSHGLRAEDAILAATAVENDLILCTSNRKHYSPIKELKLKVFKP